MLNATFFIDPYSPDTLRYWMAFNDHQLSVGGDPFVGAKLGNLLQSVGFRDVQTEVKTFHLDNRAPGERAEFLAYWTELLLSGAPALLAANKVSAGDRPGDDPRARAGGAGSEQRLFLFVHPGAGAGLVAEGPVAEGPVAEGPVAKAR